VELPSWQDSSKEAWPPHVPMDLSMFAPAPFDKHFSPRWHEALEEDNARKLELAVQRAAEEEARKVQNWDEYVEAIRPSSRA
jgi:hypothetical protein